MRVFRPVGYAWGAGQRGQVYLHTKERGIRVNPCMPIKKGRGGNRILRDCVGNAWG